MTTAYNYCTPDPTYAQYNFSTLLDTNKQPIYLKRIKVHITDDNNQKPKRICYLTGMALKTPEEAYNDYLKSLKASEDAQNVSELALPFGKEPLDPARESLEHIIPNAIGGKLKSKNILSHAGNQQLNDEIDKEFVKIFASFTSRLSVNRDRKSSPTMSAFHIDHGVKVNFKNGKYFPATPYYNKNSKTIYAYPLKNAENYKRRLIKEGVISETDHIELADDMAGQIEVPFGLGNKNFKQGMAKVAIGYATFHRVAREHFDEALDIKNNAISDRISLVPSFPTSQSERYFEENVHTSPYYPCHTLTLCGHKGLLYCHIELFNAFQWYVILSYDYQGADIYKDYTHDLLNDHEILRSDYIASVKLPPELPSIKNFRKLSPHQLGMLAKIASTDKETLKSYNHLKFYQLSKFTKHYFVYHKAISLGIIKKDVEF